MSPRPLGSIFVPAHDESAVIGRCLGALAPGIRSGALHVVVACNGCRDGTADVVRAMDLPVRLIELDVASKTAALRAADDSCDVFPRLYVDADVVLSSAAAEAVLGVLAAGALAARPPIRYDTTGASAVVRSYYRTRIATPALMGALWGAGVYGLSEAGRARFGPFPEITADDLYVDSLFTRHELVIADCEPVSVRTPRTTRDLMRVLTRSHRGKRDVIGRSTSSSRTLRDVLASARTGGRAAADAAVYVTLLSAARVLAHHGAPTRWERDESSRTADV